MGDKHLLTLERAFEIIDAIQRMDGARLTELADEVGLAPSTLHQYLATLEAFRYLTKDEGEYHLGMQFLNRGGYARSRKEEYRLAGEKVEKLAAKTGERVQFVVEEGGLGYCLHTVAGEEALQAGTRIGREMYLHDTASGKAILSELPTDRVDAIIEEHGLPELTEKTITEKADLYDELKSIREKGYALNKEETFEGIHAIGASVQSPDQSLLGAFSIVGPSKRLNSDRLEDLANVLLATVNEMELNISYKI